MRKVAIFVEGQTELIFVREFLLRWYEYQIDIECRTLFSDGKFLNAEYDFPCDTAEYHVQIVDVGMDDNVLTRMLNREEYMYNSGYQLLIGLRDMYSENYRKKSKNHSVDLTINERFKQGTIESIKSKALQENRIRFCFAIMEIESWWIGIPSLWKDIDTSFKNENIQCFIKPELIFHPATFVGKLLQSQNGNYSKKRGEVESIVGKISREDYIELNESQRCLSFCELVQYIQNE